MAASRAAAAGHDGAMATLKRRDLPRHLAKPGADLRLLLFAGPDESATREAAAMAVAALADAGDPLSVVDVAAEDLRSDPGRLADEAASVSMFGGRRVIRVRGATEWAREAVELLLAAPVAGNPVVMLAGELAKSSGLRKAAEGSPRALAMISYPIEGRELARWLEDEARSRGLRLGADVASRLLALDSDIGILASELDKFALYLDATPEAPRRLDPETLSALAAGGGEEDMAALVSAVVAGNSGAVERQLALLEGGSAIPALRAIARRLLQMTEARAAMDGGLDPGQAVRALRPPVYPFREQDALAAALPRWPLPRLRRALAMLLEGERRIKTAGGPGDLAGWRMVLEVGRARTRDSTGAGGGGRDARP